MENNEEIAKAELNPVPDLVRVINRVSLIENWFNHIIQSYVRPRDHAALFVWNVLLDTSVMSLGAKFKVVMAISQEVQFKVNKNALHEVISLRNAFAHSATNAHQVVDFGVNGVGGEGYSELWILRPTGEHEVLRRDKAFEKFNKNYALAKASLMELGDAVHKQLVEHAAFAADRLKEATTLHPDPTSV